MDYTKQDGTIVSEEWMDAVTEAAEADALHDPIIAVEVSDANGDELTTIPVEFPMSCLVAIEKAAERIGESRTDFIRNAVDKALLTA